MDATITAVFYYIAVHQGQRVVVTVALVGRLQDVRQIGALAEIVLLLTRCLHLYLVVLLIRKAVYVFFERVEVEDVVFTLYQNVAFVD